MVKIKATDCDVRSELKSCVEIFRGHIIDVTPSTYTVQLAGDSDKLDAFIEAGYEGWANAEMCPTYSQYSDQMIYNTSATMDRILRR